MSPKSITFAAKLEKCIIMATRTMSDVKELAKKELLSLEEFKTLGHARLQQLIRTEVVC